MTVPSLHKKVLKSLLCFNSLLPTENMKVWITISEMRERLVVCGVHICLTTDILQKALTRVNRGGALMEQRNDGPTSFYRPALYGHDSEAPLDQLTVRPIKSSSYFTSQGLSETSL